MPRRRVLCSGGCGTRIAVSERSRAEPTCRECRRRRLAAVPPCSGCGQPMGANWRYTWLRGGPVQLPPLCLACRTAATDPVPPQWAGRDGQVTAGRDMAPAPRFGPFGEILTP